MQSLNMIMKKRKKMSAGKNVMCRSTELRDMVLVQEMTNNSFGLFMELLEIKLNIKTLVSGIQ